jgi:adenylate cyclase, class 2
MKEIEILVEVFDEKEQVLQKIGKFDFCGEKETFDAYFFDPKRDDLKPDADGALDRCLRLRKKGDKSLLAYKIDRFDENDKWLYSDEYETEVSDFKTAREILNCLGLEVLVEVKSRKHIYKIDKYEIVFEEVEDLGLFLEVEILEDNDNCDVSGIKKEIWGFIESLGIEIGEELNVGKPELMLKKVGFSH